MKSIISHFLLSELNKLSDLKGRIMFVIRIGYVKDYPDGVSIRRPVERFNIFK